jgi:hypothetical protein
MSETLLKMMVGASLLVGFVCSCQGEAPTREEAPSTPSEDKETRLKNERERVEREALSKIDSVCEIDRDCTLYLRCQEKVCAVPPAVDGAEDPDAPVISIAGQTQFYMELALDDAQRARGLMYRPRMSDQWSMLFVYTYDQPLSFWMKNTLIPLDIVFIDDSSKVVGVSHNAEPLTLTSRSVEGESRYVLEVNAGLAERYNIKKGDHVEFIRLDESLTPSGLP